MSFESGCYTEPHNYHLCSSIYIWHQPDLSIPLLEIGLINTDGIDPNRLLLFTRRFQAPDINQSGSEILTDFKVYSIQQDCSFRGTITPGIRQRLIFGPIAECDMS
jgi:hypothetical protein